MTATIAVGLRFSSYEELQRAILDFERENKVTFWKREAKTLESASKRTPKLSEIRPQLKYYTLKYACIAGGRSHKKRCTDDSRKSKTVRQNCPVFIQVRLSADKQFLEIKDMNVQHEHPVSETFFYPRSKRRGLKRYMKLQGTRNISDVVNEVHLSKNIHKKAKSTTSVNGKTTLIENTLVPFHVDFYNVGEEAVLINECTEEHVTSTPTAPHISYLGSKDGSSTERVKKCRTYKKKPKAAETHSEALDLQIKTYDSIRALEEENKSLASKLDKLTESVIENNEILKSVGHNVAILTEIIAKKCGFDVVQSS